jgi:hypothetical protein
MKGRLRGRPFCSCSERRLCGISKLVPSRFLADFEAKRCETLVSSCVTTVQGLDIRPIAIIKEAYLREMPPGWGRIEAC